MNYLRNHRVGRAGGFGALAGVGVCVLAPVALAGELTIRDLAPQDSIFVLGADNTAALLEAFDRTGFRSLWDEPATQEWLKESLSDFLPSLTESLENLGMTKEDLRPPVGACGIAMWSNVGNPDAATSSIAMADFGEHAQEMHDTLLEALERAADKDLVELVESDYEDVTVWSVKPLEQEDAADDEDEDFGDFDGEGEMAGWLGDMGKQPSFYAHSGDYLLVASDEDTLHSAIDRVTGDRAPSVEENADFAAARRQIGQPPAYAIFVASTALKMAQAAAADSEDAAQLAEMLPIFNALGLTEIKALGVGVKFDGEVGMLEAPMGVLAPTKRGLLSLMDVSGPFEAPAFVGPDVASLMLFRFNFAGVLPLVNQVIGSLPEEQAMDAQGMVGMATMTAGPLLANIGPEMHVINHYERPFAADSQRTLFALAVKDAAAVAQSLAGLQGMLGMASRDFQGNQIWSAGNGMEGAPSIGLGFGRLFVGPPEIVENAMRQAGVAGGPTLAAEEGFREATRVTHNQGMMYSWTDMAKSVDWYDWSSKNMEQIIKAQIAEAFGPDEPQSDEEREWRMEAERNALEQIPQWVKEMPAGDIIKKHVGDTVTEFRPTPQGFEGRMLWLRP